MSFSVTSLLSSSSLFLVVAITILALFSSAAAFDIPEISPQELYDGIESGRFDAIVDVRRPEEWDTGHIPDATWLPNLQEAKEIPVEIMGCRNCGNKTIVLYCKSGSRSAAAIEHIQSMGGFEDVTVYNGMGVVQWTDAGFDLVSTDSSPPSGCNVDDCPAVVSVPVVDDADADSDNESTTNSNNTMIAMTTADDSTASAATGIVDGTSRILFVSAAIIVAIVGAVW
mmetsp:Transcript_3738/g.4047  ORF Transcript_3738/g.4047 Transcript_3738/m.4047 type:complete len:227 (-) Transcript_3738:86-766(-)